jgi:hypothetical protein
MTKLLALAVLMASTQAQPAGAPRLELTVGPSPKSALPGFLITLTLVNDSEQSVEIATPLKQLPSVIGPSGRPVDFSDFRDAAGVPMPQVPAPPVEPVRPGERREVDHFYVLVQEHGYVISGPYGGGMLSPGRHVIQVSTQVVPTTRGAWVASYVTGCGVNDHKRGESPAHAADRHAALYEKHWAEVPSFWTGPLASNTLEFTIPAAKP